jgi:hypothetical protein
MITRILLSLTLGASLAYAAENTPSTTPAPATPPSETSIKQLLEVAQARKLIDSVMMQTDEFMTEAIRQATQGQQIPAKVQKDIDKREAELAAFMKELLDWNKLEPIYVRIYQKTFSQQEVDGMIAFYKTPAGQAVISKMPAAMQNTMNEMQTMMGPVMQKIQRMQQEVLAEIKAEKPSPKKGG